MSKLEYYVMTYDFNTREMQWKNLFNHGYVYEASVKLARKFLRKKKNFTYEDHWDDKVYKGWDAYIKRLRIIMLSVWSKVECEISVGPPFPRDDDRFEKIDWYDQIIRNIDIVGREVIRHVKELKHERKTASSGVQDVQCT